MADPKSSDRPADSTGGPVEGQEGSFAPASEGYGDARAVPDRGQIAKSRVDTAATRDSAANARDVAAHARDEAAEAHERVLVLAASEAVRAADDEPRGMLLSATENRARGAADRAVAAEDRSRAADDREQAADDRIHAERDRSRAEADRGMLLLQLAIAEAAKVTAPPAASRQDLDREIARARRANGVLAVACVEVVGLERVNAASAQRADDALLLRVVCAIQSRVRAYDLVLRLGGDAFLCAMGGATIQDAVVRFASLQTALAADPDPCEIRVGVAALAPEDSAVELVTRAVAELASGR